MHSGGCFGDGGRENVVPAAAVRVEVGFAVERTDGRGWRLGGRDR